MSCVVLHSFAFVSSGLNTTAMASLGRASPLWLLACCVVALSLLGAQVTARDVKKTKVTSVGWSGSGLMIIYHAGVVRGHLQPMGLGGEDA